MRKHARSCWGEEALAAADEAKDAAEARGTIVKGLQENGTITSAFQRKGNGKVTYSIRPHTKTEVRAEIVRWVAESVRPFRIVKDRGFLSLMKTGRPQHYIPSPSTVSRDVRLVFVRARSRIAKMLQTYEGQLSYGTDAWTAPNHRPFVGFTVHLERAGQPFGFPLDIVEVASSHSGEGLAKVFKKTLQEFGVEEKMLAVAADNASANDTMIDELSKLIDTFPGETNCVRCFLHVVNLIAKTLIRQFDVPKKDQNAILTEDERELQELAEGVADDLAAQGDGEEVDELLEVNEDDWIDEIELLTAEERANLEQSIRPLRLVLAKLRKLAFKMINSPTKLLPTWYTHLDALRMIARVMPRDVATRWNSTFDMLEFAIEYRLGIDKICADRNAGLRQLELSEREWECARQLCDVLKVSHNHHTLPQSLTRFWRLLTQVFKDATLYFSRATPNLAMVIPAMDHVDERLTTDSINRAFDPAVRASLGLAKKTLNRYYSKTDLSETYRTAMVLHPRHKLSYFKQARWEPEWIDEAERIVREKYELSYEKRPCDEDDSDVVVTGTSQTSIKSNTNIFDSIPALSAPKPSERRSELDIYLATDPEHVADALAWWHERRGTYPHLSRMALDYLSIPATSVDVERMFSCGRLVLSHVRSRLSAQSTRALICLGAWSRLGLVKDDDVKAVTVLAELEGEDQALEDGWDSIKL
ncbi:putative AC9 transposase [Grifola frondosa]|uniref:Putative AC9 transposase n=1 Tax=Grifola frondosa TaxID=5627 RepID=A0A1C7MRI0_GRIFR|nr:putative AC9 transposase [Grifola frondosa]